MSQNWPAGWIRGLVLLLLVATWLLSPFAQGVDIPKIHDVIVESDITGVFRQVATSSDNSFVAVGHTGRFDLCVVPPGLLPCVPRLVNITPAVAIVFRYSSSGNLLWNEYIQLTQNTSALGVAVDDAVYVVGNQNLTISGTTPFGFVTKYSLDGVREWLLNISVEGAVRTTLTSIVVQGSQLVISGSQSANPPSTGGPILLTMTKDGGNITVNKYSGANWVDLAIVNSSTYFTAGELAGCMAKVTLAEALWKTCDHTIASYFSAQRNHNGNSIAAGYLDDSAGAKAVLVNRSSSGDVNWIKYFRPQSTPYSGRTATLLNDRIYLTGTNGSLVAATNPDTLTLRLKDGDLFTTIFLNKYSSASDLFWSTEYGDITSNVFTLGASIDSRPYLLIAGGQVNVIGTQVQGNPMVVRYEDI